MPDQDLLKRAYKYRFYPTPEQQVEFIRTWGCVRVVYNRALSERAAARRDGRPLISYGDTSKMLTAWKRNPGGEFLSEVSSVPLQQSLRNLQMAYQNFSAKRTRHPRFKSKRKGKLSLSYSKSGFRFKGGNLHIAKCADPLNVVVSRDFPRDSASTVTISRDAANRWYVSILCESPKEVSPGLGNSVGIDLGVKDLAIASTGEKFNFDRDLVARKEKRIRRAQRALSRKAPGSANRGKAKLKLAREHAKLSDYRHDCLHKITSALVDSYDVICIEDLDIVAMLQESTKGRRRSLNRGVSRNMLGEFRTHLEYKSEWRGRRVVVVDRWFPSSKMCSNCKHLHAELSLSDRSWTCSSCGATHDRDVNASRNIQTAGLAALACGDGVGVRVTSKSSALRSSVEAGTFTREGRGKVKIAANPPNARTEEKI